MKIQDIVSDDQLDLHWGNANFGPNTSKRQVIADSLLKFASGYATGHTATLICRDLGLIRGQFKRGAAQLTRKGQQYLFVAFSDKI